MHHYAIALHVAKTKKPHNIGETLLKPCILESVKLVLGEKASQTMKQLSLFNDWMKAQIYPIYHSYLSMSDMLQMKGLMRNFCSVNLWKQHQRQSMFFKC